MFDVYTRDGEYLGIKEKSFCHSENPMVYHKPVWIWIVNDNKEILIQKRSKYKKNEPNLWDMSSEGHVLTGEKIIDGAIRETFEELGIETTKDEYEFLFEYIYDEAFEIAEVFLLKKNIDLSKIILQEEEVSEVKWLTYEEFEKILFSNKFVPLPDEYKEKIIKLLKENY